MFDNAKQIRYHWFLKDLDNKICETKALKVVKFNKRYNAFKHFMLKDNELYCWVLKIGQPKRLIVYDYNAVKTI